MSVYLHENWLNLKKKNSSIRNLKVFAGISTSFSCHLFSALFSLSELNFLYLNPSTPAISLNRRRIKPLSVYLSGWHKKSRSHIHLLVKINYLFPEAINRYTNTTWKLLLGKNKSKPDIFVFIWFGIGSIASS